MLQLRGLQNESKHEDLQRLWEETILQCVSCSLSHHIVYVSEHVSPFYAQLVQPASQRTLTAVFNLSTDGNRTLQMCVCNHVATQLRPLSPSSAVYQWLFQLPPQRKALYVVWESASLPPSSSSVGKRGVSTKEIPKVPLQWHRRSLWKLACPLTLQHILTHYRLIRNPWNPPLPLLIMIFSPSLSLCVRVGGWVHVRRGNAGRRRCFMSWQALLHFFPELPFYCQ